MRRCSYGAKMNIAWDLSLSSDAFMYHSVVSQSANINWKFEWLWLYAFVHPSTGQTYWWIIPYVNTQLFNRVLAEFAREFGLGIDKHILLVEDPRSMAYQQELGITIYDYI